MDVGPKSDIDVPIEEHIQELFYRLLIVTFASVLTSLIVLPFEDTIIQYLWSYHIPNPVENRPILYSPISLFFTRLYIISVFGIAISFPIIVYEAYQFLKLGLYPHEEQYFKIAVISSLVLSVLGILVSQFVLIPLLFYYVTTYTSDVAMIAFGLQETIGTMVATTVLTVISFQLPILILLSVVFGVVDHNWYRQRRVIFWVLGFTIAFFSSPDPTGVMPVLIGLVSIIMFELSLVLTTYITTADTIDDTTDDDTNA